MREAEGAAQNWNGLQSLLTVIAFTATRNFLPEEFLFSLLCVCLPEQVLDLKSRGPDLQVFLSVSCMCKHHMHLHACGNELNCTAEQTCPCQHSLPRDSHFQSFILPLIRSLSPPRLILLNHLYIIRPRSFLRILQYLFVIFSMSLNPWVSLQSQRAPPPPLLRLPPFFLHSLCFSCFLNNSILPVRK